MAVQHVAAGSPGSQAVVAAAAAAALAVAAAAAAAGGCCSSCVSEKASLQLTGVVEGMCCCWVFERAATGQQHDTSS